MRKSNERKKPAVQAPSIHRREFIKAAAVMTLCAGLPELTLAAADKGKERNSSNLAIKSWQTSPPTFVRSAKRLTPHQIARQCWQGYLTKQPDPWGMTRRLKPMLRLHFNNEMKETPGELDGTQYAEKWRGNTIVAIALAGKWTPKLERPELNNDNVPQ